MPPYASAAVLNTTSAPTVFTCIAPEAVANDTAVPLGVVDTVIDVASLTAST